MSSDRARSAPDSSTVVAYLVLAHTRSDQVVRLAHRICDLSDDARVLIHWDAKAPSPFPIDQLPDRAEVIPTRVRASWGTWSLVEASLALFAAAREAHHPRWSVLVSGVDWPARRLDEWERQLDHLGADALVDAPAVPSGGGLPDGGRSTLHTNWGLRYHSRWCLVPSVPWEPGDRILRTSLRPIERLQGPRRRAPALLVFGDHGYAIAWRRSPLPRAHWTLYKGSQWATLGPRAVDALLSTPRDVTEHFRRTLIPDEAFIQTVLHNAHDVVVRWGQTSFAPWGTFPREPHLVLHEDDLPEVVASGAPFARKVGTDELAAVTELLDDAVDRQRAGSGGRGPDA